MPEEVNRVVVDHLAGMLLCPSEIAVRNLTAEGISQNVHLVGDVMLDVLNWARPRADAIARQLLHRLGLTRKEYVLATVHRSENTDDPARLSSILEAFNSLDEPVVFPVHPRARKVIAEIDCRLRRHVHVITPVAYLDMVALTESARLVLTDSGGLQKEAYWLSVPCITLRNETEWIETVAAGWNLLVGADHTNIAGAVESFSPPASHPALYGDGAAAARCVDLLGQVAGVQQQHRPEITEIANANRTAR